MANWGKIASVTSETVEYLDAGSEMLAGCLARLADAGSGPAIAVIQECWGVDEHIKDIRRRFAREGFFALTSDFYHYVVVTKPTRRVSW